MLKTLHRKFGFTAYTWGNSKLTAHTPNPAKKGPIQPIESLRGRIAKIAFSAKHAAAVTTDGFLFTWGDKSFGKLGHPGKLTDVLLTPTEVPFFSKNGIIVKDVAIGQNHTLVLDTKGNLYSFGKGKFSDKKGVTLFFSEFVGLGHPEAEHVAMPKKIKALDGIPVDQVSTGHHFSTAITKDGRLMVWGRGEYGVLGFTNKQTPQPIENPIFQKMCETGGLKIEKVKSFADFTSVLMSDGLTYSFGNNDEGVMGIGKSMGMDLCEVVNLPLPVAFSDDPTERVADYDLGETSGCILGTSGKAYQTGQKLYFNPELIPIDYENQKVTSIAAFAKGAGVVTENNQIFYRGNFWPTSAEIDEDVNTAVKEVKFGNIFNGKRIVEIGHKFGEVGHVLVDESKGDLH